MAIFSVDSGVADSIFGKSQDPIKMLVEERAEALKAVSLFDKLFKEVPTDNYAEKFTGMTSMESFSPTGEGGAYPKLSLEEGYSRTIEPETWKGQFVITQEAVEDKKVGKDGKPQQMVTSYYRAREEFGHGLLIAAANGKAEHKVSTRQYSTKSADGSILFATDHKPKVSGANQCNKFKDNFSAEALSKAETAMQNFCDDNGHVLLVRPSTILIPNDGALKAEVLGVIGADRDPNTEAGNAYNIHHGRWNVIIDPYLNTLIGKGNAGATPWFLLDLDYSQTYNGAVRTERVPLTFHSWIDRNNDNNVWNGRGRFSAGFVDFRFALAGGAAAGNAL